MPGVEALAQRGNATGAVDILAVAGAAGIDIARLRFAAGGAGIEVDIEHAGRADELQLAGIAFPDLEPGAPNWRASSPAVAPITPSSPGAASVWRRQRRLSHRRAQGLAHGRQARMLCAARRAGGAALGTSRLAGEAQAASSGSAASRAQQSSASRKFARIGIAPPHCLPGAVCQRHAALRMRLSSGKPPASRAR